MLRLDLKKIFQELRGPDGLAAISAELKKVSDECKKLRKSIEPEAKARLKIIRARMVQLEKVLMSSQRQFESEIKRSLGRLKKQAQKTRKDVEGTLKGSKRGASVVAKKVRKKATRKSI